MSSSGEPLDADPPRGLDAPVELPRRRAAARTRRGRTIVVDARALDLHDDAGAVVQHGAVRLADRGGGERLEVERGERLLDRLVELRLERRRGRRPAARADVGREDARARR